MRNFILCFVVVFSVLFRPNIAAACSPDFSHNYWYKETYQVDLSQLPTDLTLSLHEEGAEEAQAYFIAEALPAEPMFLIESMDEPETQAQVDELYALYEAGGPDSSPQLNPFGRQLKLGEWIALSEHIDGADERNPQSPGGITADPPAPYVTEILIADLMGLYRVPITITYSVNPNYESDRLVYDAPVSDALLLATHVVVATAIDPKMETYDEPSIHEAPFQVDAWLKGSGTDRITMSAFGADSLCLSSMPHSKTIFLLEENSDQQFYQFRMLRANATNQKMISELVGQEPFIPEQTVLPTEVPVEPTEVSMISAELTDPHTELSDGDQSIIQTNQTTQAANQPFVLFGIAVILLVIVSLIARRMTAGSRKI